ncbi:hypothetical protein Ae406Ps2_5085 [Pseudonocardia sp. Ae406_Ps2]|uniref:hypothetical protein n=1 Tax=unclassified Pseudonocardia TaxID=2619320 RepID=UPI00094AFC36|nr:MULTISPECIES: hypothetical protein [unclassified Pseudonocardia]OLM05085.1 hypothetical protein Ae406Ps2_5085 [Pseudonocardia sp. Ae406_Ps2]OLM10102.1 hypothetical protein Ae505Ps2_0224c [Pseudonocardia sp. Ae505_Ps2]OLM26654.1 hypothetical protein Ae706Ps2_5087 [Pseudonocardia sp. Ae706_Ps2]OLM33271.1 hypothetical protein Ae717Ps2_4167c [Pseudonocardia sp. Ae717_Ps2]
MAEDTKVDRTAIEDAAGKLGKLMDDMKAFTDLDPHWPDAGKFSVAQYVERRVDDRRNAVIDHAKRLKTILDAMEPSLKDVSKLLTEVDSDSAAAVGKRIDQLRADADKQIVDRANEIEHEQHNFTTGDESEASNTSDGDGYDDTQGQIITGVPKGEEGVGSVPKDEVLNAPSQTEDTDQDTTDEEFLDEYKKDKPGS